MKKRRDEIEWSKMTEEQLEIIDYYCRDNMRQLKRICDPIIRSHGLPNMYYEDLYTIAVDTIGKSLFTYDETKSQFETYLVGNLKRKFNSWIRDNTRGCRCNVLRDENGKIIREKDENGRERNIIIPNVSFDIPNEDGTDLKEIIDSGFNIETELGLVDFDKSDKVQDYLNRLTKKQRRIGILLSQGYTKNEIREYLHMEQKEFADQMFGMMSYEKVSVLF